MTLTQAVYLTLPLTRTVWPAADDKQ